METDVIIKQIVTGDFASNAYVVRGDSSEEAVIIDAGGAAGELLGVIETDGLRLTHIINTHGHADHMAANAALKDAFPDAKICIHGRDAHMLSDARANLSMPFGFEAISPAADILIEGNTELEAGGVTFRIEQIGGHSPGSVALVVDGEPTVVFSGDTLFQGTIGRTDFPGGNMEVLLSGIKEKILSLPGDTVVYPGHGEPTTVACEKAGNPFLR
jgi:glyoxylase-like metal-dependent hydrolase (beta-lactamase superfamily II)